MVNVVMVDRSKSGHRQGLRERFLGGDEASRTDEAVLELLLTYAIPRKDVQTLAEKLIAEFGSLSGVLEAEVDALCKIDGIKANTAVLIKLVDWVKAYQPSRETQSPHHAPSETTQLGLFDSGQAKFEAFTPAKKEKKAPSREKVRPRRGTELFGKAVLKEAIDLLPSMPDTASLDEVRQNLRGSLHYSAEQTRKRYANYITRRMFPDGHADRPMRLFAKHFPDSKHLREVCFYRFMKAEPLVGKVVTELLYPNLGNGRLDRERIRAYLAARFPSSRSITDSSKALVDALVAGGLAKADRIKISFGYREISIPAFAFVVHSEFPEPGMYDITKLDTNHTIQAMLWNPDRIVSSLYELRNQGVINKVSQIDNIRQFTTKWTLDQVVEHLVAGEKET